MSGLDDAYGGRAPGDRWRLYLGTALLLAGAVVAALGLVDVVADLLSGVGLAPPVATKAAIAVAGLLLPAAVAGLLAWLPAGRGSRVGAGAGLGLAVLAVAAFWVTVPPAAAASASLPPIVALVYVLGTLLVVGSFVAPAAAAVLADGPVSVGSTPGSAGFSRRRNSSGQLPTDGGAEDDDLEFLLDDDEER